MRVRVSVSICDGGDKPGLLFTVTIVIFDATVAAFIVAKASCFLKSAGNHFVNNY